MKKNAADGFHEMDDDAAPIVPLTVDEWLNRDLPPPDRLLGEWLTTTSRIYMSADTGLGKTHLAVAIAVHIGARIDFLHWQCHRPARVLFIDGEMSRRLLKRRINEAVTRLGVIPVDARFFSREDVEDFPPLNTPAGLVFLLQFLDSIGGVDLIIFDNIMALLEGDQKDEVSWNAVLPLISALTKRNIGQLWIDHTGHDASRGYGSKTKQWRMDTVVHLTAAEHADADISFTLEFRKARERTPETRADFEDVVITLLDDQWIGSALPAKQFKPRPGSHPAKVLDILRGLLSVSKVTDAQGRRMLSKEAWRSACVAEHLLDDNKSGQTQFNRIIRNLVSANIIKCKDAFVWTLP